MLGYKFNIEVIMRHESNILEEIKHDLEVTTKSVPKKEKEEIKEEKPKEKQEKNGLQDILNSSTDILDDLKECD